MRLNILYSLIPQVLKRQKNKNEKFHAVGGNFCGVEFLLFGDIVLANAGGGWLDLNLGK